MGGDLRRAVRRAAHRGLARVGIFALWSGRILDRRELRREGDHTDGTGHGRRSLLLHGGVAPHRGVHPPGKHRLAPGGGKTWLPRRGRAGSPIAHQRRLARSRLLCNYSGGSATRHAAPMAVTARCFIPRLANCQATRRLGARNRPAWAFTLTDVSACSTGTPGRRAYGPPKATRQAGRFACSVATRFEGVR